MGIEVVDPATKVWKPTQRQLDFLRLPNTIFEGFYGGAAGGGKSELLMMYPIARGFYKLGTFKAIIFRKTYVQLEESLIPRSQEYYPLFGGKYNAQKHVWVFPSGAKIWFSYLEKDTDAQDHDTAEYNLAMFDELTHFGEYVYRYITSRVRSSKPELPAIVRCASNPGNIGHSWVKNRFVSPHKAGYKPIFDTLSNSYRIYIPSKLTDNPHLLQADPAYINRLNLLPEVERRAKLDGDWDVFQGQVFSEFRDIHMPDEPDNALHVIKPFEIPSWWPRILGIDWGYAAETWAGWAAVSPDERLYLYREYIAHQTSIENWSSDIARLSQGEPIQQVALDPSAWKNYGMEMTIAEKFMKHSGMTAFKAMNGRVAGKQLIHDYLRFLPRPKKFVPPEGFSYEQSQRILRLYGMRAYDDYCNTFKVDENEKRPIPILQIFNTCPRVIDALKACVYSDTRPEDVAEFTGDDPYDGVRYLIGAADFYLKSGTKEAVKRSELNEILKDQSDQTGFYIRMAQYEAKNKSRSIPKGRSLFNSKRLQRSFTTRKFPIAR